jgi:hypothetical protein
VGYRDKGSLDKPIRPLPLLPPRAAYVGAGVVLGAGLVGLIVWIAVSNSDYPGLRLALAGAIIVDLTGFALLASAYQKRQLAVAALTAAALDAVNREQFKLAATSPVARSSQSRTGAGHEGPGFELRPVSPASPTDQIFDTLRQVEAIEEDLRRIGATREAAEVANARRQIPVWPLVEPQSRGK